ncbi:MAG: hypothetical protein HQ513_14770 [Rhodospirillales bacterium]|nr:hypothetical protein [Rhodospirillales bacterium]
MEHRVYFIFGDVLACVVAGAAAGWLVQYVVPGDWFPLVGMMVGMVIGMAVGMLSGFFFSPFFGAFEVMLPASLSGMLAGMVVGMTYSMGENSPADAAISGAGLGLVCLAFTYFLQAKLHGEVS